MYLITGYYRGALYISPMRVFTEAEKDQAREYKNTLEQDHEVRVYLVSNNADPKLIKDF